MSETVSLGTLGPVVGYYGINNAATLSTWSGHTATVWARFKHPIGSIPMTEMRDDMVEAFGCYGIRPPGFYRTICFTSPSEVKDEP